LASASVFAPAKAADNNGGDSRPTATASDPWWYATGKNGVPAGTLAAAANRKLPIPPAVWRAIATIASPAAVTPAGDALRSGEATCTEKLTFFVVLTSSAAHAPNSGSPPSGESTGPMLRSTPSATTARSSACRAVSASARARLFIPSKKGCVATRRV